MISLRPQSAEAPQKCLIVNDHGVMPDVRCGRDALGELDEIGRASDRIKLSKRTQSIAERDRIDGGFARGQFKHGQKNVAVGFAIEVIRAALPRGPDPEHR